MEETIRTEIPDFLSELQTDIKNQGNQLKQEDIIEEEFVIDETNLRDLYVMGKGGFGEVKVVYDTRNLKRYAKKTFNDYRDYKDEKDGMRQIEQLFDGDFEEIACALAKYDNEKMTLYYNLGVCSLQEFISLRSEQNIYWWQNQQELCYILQQSYKFFNTLFEKNLFHTDIKPANIVLIPKSDVNVQKVFEIRFIDFGSCGQNYNQLKAYTQLYFIPNINEIVKEKGYFFANKEERIKAEIYTLARTMIRIMLDSIWVKEERNPQDSIYFDNTEEGNQQALKKLYTYYSKELVEVIEAMINQQDPQKYKEALYELYSREITDNEGLADAIIDQKEFISLGSLQIEQTEQNVEELYRNSLYERALKLIDALQEDVWKSLNLLYYKIILLNQLGYFKRLVFLTKEILERKNEFQAQYLESDDLNKKKIYFNTFREAIWHIQTRNIIDILDEQELQCIKIFGQVSDMVALSYYQKAKIETSYNRQPEALRYFQKCFDIYDKIEKNYQNQQNLALALKYCGLFYQQNQNHQKALEYFEKEGEIWINIAGKEHGEYGGALFNQSITKYHLQKYEEGYQQIKQAISIFLNSFGAKNQYYSGALSWIVLFCVQLKKHKEGGQYSLQASLLMQDQVGTLDNNYQQNLKNLCENYQECQNNLTGLIQSEILDKYEDNYKLEKYVQAEKYLNIAGDALTISIQLGYIKEDDPFILQTYDKYMNKLKIIKIKIKQKNILNKQDAVKEFKYLFSLLKDDNEKAFEIMQQSKLLKELEARTIIRDFLKNDYSENGEYYFDLLIEQSKLEIQLGILDDAENNLNYIKEKSNSKMQKDFATTYLMSLYEVMKKNISINPQNKVELYNIYEKQINLLKIQLGQTSLRFKQIVQSIAQALEDIEMFFQAEKLIKNLIENSLPTQNEIETYYAIIKRLHKKKKLQLKQRIMQQKLEQQGWKSLDRFFYFYDLNMNIDQKVPKKLQKYETAKLNVIDCKKSDLSELFQIFMFNQQSSGYVLIKNFTPDTQIYLCNKLYQMAQWFFTRTDEQKLQYAKKHINPQNDNTYRGYENYDNKFEELNVGYINGILENCENQESIKIPNLYEDLNWPKFSSNLRKNIEEQHEFFDKLNEFLLNFLGKINQNLDNKKVQNLFRNPINTNSNINCSSLYMRKIHTGRNIISKDDGEKLLLNETDPQGFLSYQVFNHQYGLQIKQDGKWKNVAPIDNSILVSLGGLFSAITESEATAPYRIVDCGEDFYQSEYVSEFEQNQDIPLDESDWNIQNFRQNFEERNEQQLDQNTIKIQKKEEIQSENLYKKNLLNIQTAQSEITLLNKLKVEQSDITQDKLFSKEKSILEYQNNEDKNVFILNNQNNKQFNQNPKNVRYGDFKAAQLGSILQQDSFSFQNRMIIIRKREYTPESTLELTIDFDARKKQKKHINQQKTKLGKEQA